MTRGLTTIYKFLIDIILPPRKTERMIRSLTQEDLHSLATLDAGGRAVLPYHEPLVRALVWELKYRKNAHALALAGAFLADQALALGEDILGGALLVPVPMHTARRKARGYNQCELICEAIMQHSKNSFEYAPRALERVRNTPAQQGLAKHRRLKNIKGAMQSIAPAAILDKVCVVIDDVRTTGATAAECERTLLQAGASEVHIITLAQS